MNVELSAEKTENTTAMQPASGRHQSAHTANVMKVFDPNQLALNELIAAIDDKLFFQAMYNNCHVLNSILPNETHRTYNKLGSADITGHFLLNNTP